MEDKFYAKAKEIMDILKILKFVPSITWMELVECFKWLCTKEMKNTIYMDAVLEEIKKWSND